MKTRSRASVEDVEAKRKRSNQTEEQVHLTTCKSEELRSLESLSSIERLPQELVWMIIEFAPESIHDLRLSSRLLKAHVDDLVRMPVTISLVQELQLRLLKKSGNSLRTLDIRIHVSLRNRKMFELRLKSFPELVKSIERHANIIEDSESESEAESLECSRYASVFEYDFQYKFIFESMEKHSTLLSHLKECIGKRVDKLFLNYRIGLKQYSSDAVFKILEGISARRLEVAARLTDDVIERIIIPILSRIEEIDLIVNEVFISNPKTFLVNLSTQLRLIRIRDLTPRKIVASNLLSIPNSDWTELIIELFSHKLDKLFIDNSFNNPKYLTPKCVDLLRKRLPMLEKKVLFVTSCASYARELDYVNKKCRIKVDCRRLSIIHSSREDESFTN